MGGGGVNSSDLYFSSNPCITKFIYFFVTQNKLKSLNENNAWFRLFIRLILCTGMSILWPNCSEPFNYIWPFILWGRSCTSYHMWNSWKYPWLLYLSRKHYGQETMNNITLEKKTKNKLNKQLASLHLCPGFIYVKWKSKARLHFWVPVGKKPKTE